MTKNHYLASKPRYKILDGLRGVAAVMVSAGCLILSVGLAYACLKLYDIPIRKWLTDHWLKKDQMKK